MEMNNKWKLLRLLLNDLSLKTIRINSNDSWNEVNREKWNVSGLVFSSNPQ